MDSCRNARSKNCQVFTKYHKTSTMCFREVLPISSANFCANSCLPWLHLGAIYDPGSRFATTPPPPPPMVWSQNLRFAAFCMKTWYLQCFLHGGWLARSANLQIYRISCNRPSENVLFAMFRLRHRGVVPIHPLLCQIIIYIYIILIIF